MFNKLINSVAQGLYGPPQAEYGVSLYGVPRDNGKIIAQFFMYILFLVLIPVILAVGVLAFAKKKQFSKKEKFWTVFVVLAIYFVVLAGAVVTVALLF